MKVVQAQPEVSYRVGIDTGGTHTDGFIQTSDGREWQVKVETTPHDLTVGFLNCLAEAAQAVGAPSYEDFLRRCELIRFSTTIGTNALLEGKGARVGLITSREWEETARTAVAGLMSDELVAGLGEHCTPDEVASTIRSLLTQGARILAVSLYRAWADPEQERRVKAIVEDLYPSHHLGAVTVLLSSDLTNAEIFGPRTALTVVNAAIHPYMARALYRAEDELRRHGYRVPLWIVHANGGSAKVSKTRAVDTYNSGPAAGIFASARLAAQRGFSSVVTMDVGGTSTDLGLIREGAVPYRHQATIAGQTVAMPVVSVYPVAGGGGSIVRISGGALRIGPDSAGSVPGPACYGIGGEDPTVTDAALLVGYLNPKRYLGGHRPLEPALAERAIASRLAERLGVSPEMAAQMVLERFAAQIAEAMRALLEPGAVLMAFGGGSGLVAARVAQLAGISDVFVPHTTAAFCAYGAATMPVAHVYDHVWPGHGQEPEEVWEALRHRALLDMQGEGYSSEQVRLERLWGALDDSSTLRFEPWRGLAARTRGVLRLRATAIPVEQWGESRAGSGVARVLDWLGHREVWWQDRRYQTPVVAGLANGEQRSGPLLVESQWATLWVPPGCRLSADELFYRLEVE